MKFLLGIFLTLYLNTGLAQQVLNITHEARYELKYRSNKQSDTYAINTFILLMNQQESFFKNMAVYVKDSLEKQGTLKKTGDIYKDMANYDKYMPEFPYTVYTNRNKVIFSDRIVMTGNYRYEEEVQLDWKLTKETSIIKGIKCIKATTSKWGRNWIAYYSPTHPHPFGPYKFHGLPGLIFKVEDEDRNFIFELYKYIRRNEKGFNLGIPDKINEVSKAKYIKMKRNSEITLPNGIDFPDMDAKRKAEILNRIRKEYENKVHLEISEE